MKFKKFNSIENAYRKKYINSIVEQGHSGGEYVVQEKVHGSNFSIYFDGKEIKAGKRTSFLNKDESFFNFQKIIDKYVNNVKELYKLLSPEHYLIIYGELYGGSYPHPDVESEPNAMKIQKGIYYCPHNDLYGFDLVVDKNNISVDKYQQALSEVEIPVAKTLFKGSFQEALEYPNEFQTIIPEEYHNLPPIENNICEGVVIRPNEPKFFNSGKMVLIKNKNKKYSEKANKPKREKKRKEVVLSESAQNLLEEAHTYITENRLRNVLSKVGEVTDKDFGKIMGMFSKDIFEDYMKDFKEEHIKLDKAEQKSISKSISKKASDLLRENFLNIIDNTF